MVRQRELRDCKGSKDATKSQRSCLIAVPSWWLILERNWTLSTLPIVSLLLITAWHDCELKSHPFIPHLVMPITYLRLRVSIHWSAWHKALITNKLALYRWHFSGFKHTVLSNEYKVSFSGIPQAACSTTVKRKTETPLNQSSAFF